MAQQETRTPAEATAELRQQADGDWERGRFRADRAELAGFDPERAGLRRMSADEADKYIEAHRATRPWLAMADRALPESRQIIAALDAAGGHAHIRHEGWVTEDANRRRVAYQEDPAQLDEAKRGRSLDGLSQEDRQHWCRGTATRISDPDAFATAYIRGVGHPRVREALDRDFDPGKSPKEVTVPIAELLGQSGYRHCTGWRLEPVDGSMKTARTNREAWIAAKADGREHDGPEPRAAPVRALDSGEFVFAFSRNDAEKRYEIATMYPRPAQ